MDHFSSTKTLYNVLWEQLSLSPPKKLICKATQPSILRGTGTGFFHVGSFLFSFSLSGKRQLFNFPHLVFPCGINVHRWQPGYHRKQKATVAIPICPRNTDLSAMKAPGCSHNKVGFVTFRSSRKNTGFALSQVPAVKVNTYECRGTTSIQHWNTLHWVSLPVSCHDLGLAMRGRDFKEGAPGSGASHGNHAPPPRQATYFITERKNKMSGASHSCFTSVFNTPPIRRYSIFFFRDCYSFCSTVTWG